VIPARVASRLATAGVLVTIGFALSGHPLPAALMVLILAAYVGIVLSGVFVLRWRVFVDAMIRGPAQAQGVALTFDDGPDPRWTPLILDLLASQQAKATFFVIGRKAEEHPQVVRAILDGGHDLGLHSYAHDRLFALRSEANVRADLERCIAVLHRLTGRRVVVFRPPIGHTNPRIARVATDLGLLVVGWTCGGRDSGPRARAERVANRVQRELKDGAIVMLHDSPERGDHRPSAIDALSSILDAVRCAGLPVVPLSKWTQTAR